eukprot:GHVO01025814.1.p1 GENE.GHVO01025814.1~~GHVO01025814.1.p1  ORF type:complete len:116 (+),score=23.16 GHVO01025814.1:36-350(+)
MEKKMDLLKNTSLREYGKLMDEWAIRDTIQPRICANWLQDAEGYKQSKIMAAFERKKAAEEEAAAQAALAHAEYKKRTQAPPKAAPEQQTILKAAGGRYHINKK